MEKEKEIHGWRNRSQDKKYQKVNTVQRRIFVSFLAKYKITSVVNTIYILLYICYIYYIICKVYIYIYIISEHNINWKTSQVTITKYYNTLRFQNKCGNSGRLRNFK